MFNFTKRFNAEFLIRVHYIYTFNVIPVPTEQCEAGFFKIGGSGECALCVENSWSNAGADYCNACPYGHVSDAGSTSGDDCRFGKQSTFLMNF